MLGKRNALGVAVGLLATLAAHSFDWPQTEIASSSFYSYFGQLRGGTLSPSLVFTESDDVKAADNGRVIIALSEHDESDLFESTLGNAVIIAHKDDLLTVYANLSAGEQEERETITTVYAGATLGTCSNSGWQEGQGCLEFQVVDTKNKSFINPRVLMPRFGQELELDLRGITVTNRKGTPFTLGVQRSLAAGAYAIYKQRQERAMPYRTAVYINGVLTQVISYDRLVQTERKLCTGGQKHYDVAQLYPDSKRVLLGEVNLPHGRNTLTLAVTDILGTEKTITYTLDAR